MNDNNYGSAKDYAEILSGGSKGATSAMKSATSNATSKAEAREYKRRILADLVNNSKKRNRNLFKLGQEHSDEMNDFQTQAMQEIARGFVNSLRGSTV